MTGNAMDQDGSPQEAGAGGAGTPPTASGGEGRPSMSPKKRRKVNHGRCTTIAALLESPWPLNLY